MVFKPLPVPTDRLSHTVAFRVTDSEYLELLPFFEAFEGQASPAIRWLLTHPDVEKAMAEAVRAANP